MMACLSAQAQAQAQARKEMLDASMQQWTDKVLPPADTCQHVDLCKCRSTLLSWWRL